MPGTRGELSACLYFIPFVDVSPCLSLAFSSHHSCPKILTSCRFLCPVATPTSSFSPEIGRAAAMGGLFLLSWGPVRWPAQAKALRAHGHNGGGLRACVLGGRRRVGEPASGQRPPGCLWGAVSTGAWSLRSGFHLLAVTLGSEGWAT